MKNKKLLFKSVLSACLIFFLINGCNSDDNSTNSNPPDGNSNTNQITMQSNSFSPNGTVIAAGTTVTWTNNDSFAHTVTSGSAGSPDGMFDSGNIGANGTFSYKFDTAGTFNYYCRLHPGMTGRITVQ